MLGIGCGTAVAADEKFAVVGKSVKKQFGGLGGGLGKHLGGLLFGLDAFVEMLGNARG